MHFLLGLALSLAAVCALHGAELATDFEKPESTEPWILHQEGDGVVSIDHGSLLMDMTAPRVGKHAWVELDRTVKLPLTLRWDQQIATNSPHLYLAGVWFGVPEMFLAVAGLSGQPLGNVAHCAGARGDRALEPGRWYRLELQVGADWNAHLKAIDRATGEQVAEFTRRIGGLVGRLCRLGFYHNQERAVGPDEYPQNRGASRFDNISLTADAIIAGRMEDYRDAELRGFDPRAPMTFNRATRWLGEGDGLRGTVLAYDGGPLLTLTGTRQAGSWHPNRLCKVEPVSDTESIFTRPNDLDGYDVAAVRTFQWCIRQRPTLEYRMTPEAGRCYLSITQVCPYLGNGIELFRTEPTTDSINGSVDLDKLFAERGLGDRQFAEIGVFIYQDRPPAGMPEGRAKLSISLTGPGALVTSPQIVRTSDRAADGVDIYAVLAGPDGQLRHAPDASLRAQVGDKRIAMHELADTGVFTCRLQGLPMGDTPVSLSANGDAGNEYASSLIVTLTNPDDFLRWAPPFSTYQTGDGRVSPCLLGDLYAWTPVLGPTEVGRRVVVSADDWRALSTEEQSRVRLLKLRTLSRKEIHSQLAAHHAAGMRVIRLAMNVTPHEAYLDAGGHVSMQGLETLQIILSECRALGMKAVLNVFHYPYGSPSTGRYPPWQQYVDAGYKSTASFTDPVLRPMLKSYLSELLTVLRDDPAMMAYSLTGENDQTYGPEFINDLFDHVKAYAPAQMVTQEQGGGAQSMSGGNPWGADEYKPTHSAGLGYRTYYTAGARSDAYFMACARAYRANPPVFCAEFASGPGWYPGFAATWTHPDFITKVRDNCWASLLCQQTMCISWSAPWTQEERTIPQACADLIDWTRFVRAKPDIAVKLQKLTPDLLSRLTDLESRLAAFGLDCDYIWEGHEDVAAPSDYALVLDPQADFAPDSVPAEILASRPLLTTGEYSVSYLMNSERSALVAFVKNTAEYKLGPGYGTAVNELHRQRVRRSPLALSLRGLKPGSRCRVYDVDQRSIVFEGSCAPDLTIDLGDTNHDFAVVVW
ncbi:MAG: hypothetical protein HPY44_10505 [Armatimonadetes bacterium]|nr:hypothetical protein [Armatimonadota bacterium]